MKTGGLAYFPSMDPAKSCGTCLHSLAVVGGRDLYCGVHRCLVSPAVCCMRFAACKTSPQSPEKPLESVGVLHHALITSGAKSQNETFSSPQTPSRSLGGKSL
jgi:hypothetical protein